MRFCFFLLLLSFFFQSCGFVAEKLNLGNLALLFSRSGQAEVSGIAMKGRVMGARVQVMPLVNNACDRTGATRPFAETTTDENGNYSVRYPKNGRPVCVLVTPSENGRTVMFDETLLRDIAWTEKNFYLDTIVQEPSGPTQAGVVSSPFSRMAARVFAKTMEKSDPSFASAVANASSRQVVSMFGLNKGFVRNEAKGIRSHGKSPDAHPRSFGKRNIPKDRVSKTRGNNSSSVGSRNVSATVVPTLEELKLDFTKPDDPFVATSVIKLSGISALANGFANGAARSIQKGLTTRATANGDALELVIDGFSEVIESGGRRNRILTQVFTQSTGRAPPANFSRNPLEAAMQSGIASFVQNSPGAQQFGLNLDEIETLFQMTSTPPTSLMVDTSSAPDYLYYADNNDEGALVLFTNTQESYYPWVEGGLPTQYEVRSGTLPAGMTLNPVTGEISGTPTTATTTSSQITIRASNLFGSTSTVFRIRVQNFTVGQPFAFVYDSDCTQSTTCNLSIGIEGIRNYNYVINSFTSTAGTFRLTSGILGTFSGTAANVNGARKGTVSYTDLNTGTRATAEVDFYIDPNTPTATVWASELVQGSPFSYVAFDVAGVGEFGTYSFVPQDFGNGMSIDRFGVISGNPTTSGTWSPSITVINASGQRFTVSLGTLTIGVAGSTPQFVGLPEILFLFYTGNCAENTPNCSLSIDTTLSALPSGVTFSSLNFSDPDGELSFYGLSIASNGTITGTPNTGGSIFVNITGTSSTGVVYDVFATLVLSGGGGGGQTGPAYVYIMNSSAKKIFQYQNNNGVLTSIASPINFSNTPIIMLWNGNHLIVVEATSPNRTARSYLKNADGTLNPTPVNSFALSNDWRGYGDPSVHPAGIAIYAVCGNHLICSLRVDSNGVFSNEVLQSAENWAVITPVHPSGNFLVSQHKSPLGQRITSINSFGDINTSGTLGFVNTSWYNDFGKCAYSWSGDYLYCTSNSADVTTAAASGIKQFAVTSSSVAELDPFDVFVEFDSALTGPKDIVMHPSGDYVYVFGTTNIFGYFVDPFNGLINSIEFTKRPAPGGCGINQEPLKMAISNNVLIAPCSTTGDIATYPIDSNGLLGIGTVQANVGPATGYNTISIISVP